MLVQVLCAYVGSVDVGRDVVDGDPSLRHELSDEKEAQRDLLRPRVKGAVSKRVQRCVLSHYNGTFAKSFMNPSSVSTFEQNTASFIAKSDTTSSASMVNIVVRPCSPDLKPICASHSIDK